MRLIFFLVLAVCSGGAAWSAQDTQEIERLRQELRQAREHFERTLREHQRIIDDLSQRLEALQPPRPSPSQTTNTLQLPAVPADAPQSSAAASATATPPAAALTRGWRPSDPLRVGSGRAFMDVGLVGTFAAGGSTASDIEGGTQSGGHDPYQRGFNVQGVELNLQGTVDPYFRGNVNVTYSLDADGESYLELEEAWMQTLSLPAHLQLRAGQIYTDFGRHNPTHLHTWSFVDTPLVNGRFLGPDGLRNPGVRLAWLLPTPFFAELSLGVQDSHGETATSFRSAGHSHGDEPDEGLPLAYRHADNDRGLTSVGDLLFSPRYAMSFDLSSAQTLLLGASVALGPNARGGAHSGDTDTQIYGVDLTWKWKSPRHLGGFPFVTWQTEGLWRKYDAGAFDWDEDGNGALDPGELEDRATGLPARLAGETLTDYGFYSQVLYGFRRGWVAALRFDFVTSDRGRYEQMDLWRDGEALGRDPRRAQRWRLSPALTWYPTEYSKIRLQYNYDDRLGLAQDHSVWLQFEFLLGAHAAHSF
jgi:hypothetical protein